MAKATQKMIWPLMESYCKSEKLPISPAEQDIFAASDLANTHKKRIIYSDPLSKIARCGFSEQAPGVVSKLHPLAAYFQM